VSNALKFRWVKPPSDLGRKIEKYGQDVMIALYAVAANWGASLQNAARSGAKWEDRTGNARSGLFFAVDGLGMPALFGQVSSGAAALKTETATISGSADRLVISLGHTVFYGKFLELNGKYAIVMSTIESNLGRLESMIQRLLR